MPQQLTIGIACDNYKVSKYKNELKKLEIEIAGESAFNSDVTLLRVVSTKEIITKLTNKVEFYFKNRN